LSYKIYEINTLQVIFPCTFVKLIDHFLLFFTGALDYFEQEPQKVEEKGEKTNSIWIHYKTNNPNLFWGIKLMLF
jgi:hypothetical protein